MEKNIANSTASKITFRLVLYLLIFTAISFHLTLCAQPSEKDSIKYWEPNTTDPFWDPHCPTSNAIFDGYHYWMLRQKMIVKAYQTILNNEVSLDDNKISKIQLTNYMPLIDAGKFNSMIGTQYAKFDIHPENDFNLNTTIQMVWLWTAWQYKTRRWNFAFTTETSFRGDEIALYNKTGNRNLILAYIGYEFNNRWNLILLGRFGEQQMVGKSKDISIAGIQARYQPSGKLKIIFGVPTIFAAEWTALRNTDMGMKFMYTAESQFFIRQRISENVSITAQYYSSLNNSDATYFNDRILNANDISPVGFNNISYFQHQLFASLDLKLYKDIGFSVGAGYNPSSKMDLYYNDDKVYSGILSEDNFFINCSLQFIRLR